MIRYIFTYIYTYICSVSLLLKSIISNKQFSLKHGRPLLRWSCKLQATLWPKQWLLQRCRCWRSPWQKQRPIVGGSGDPSFTTMRINKWFKQTNQIIHGTKGDYNSPDWFWEANKIPTIIEGSGVGIATGHQAPFQGPASNHRAEDGGWDRGVIRADDSVGFGFL